MRRLSDRFAEAAAGCTAVAQLEALLHETVPELGFDHFALLDHASLAGSRAGLIRIDNYPEAWTDELVGRGLAGDDPVHLACTRAGAGFGWCELSRLICLEPRHRRILARSRYHGLGGGFTIPWNIPGEPCASCSFAFRTGSELPLPRLHCAELVGLHALGAARRLRCVSRSPRPRLSRREVECLRWVAFGKSDWEIARILGISVETVHQYVKRARAAYDSVSRAQLVVHALRDCWIGFDDAPLPSAIPPDG